VREEIKKLLWPKGTNDDVWALVDGARDTRVYWSLVNSYLPFGCLFAGELPEALERVAPYVIQLDPEDGFTDLLLAGWGRSLGVYLQCREPLPALRHHLRKFLTVTDPAGDRVLFRYYDPRVLRAYLPTCQTHELETVFGPIEVFWMEARDPAKLLEFRFNGRELKIREHAIG
jgi:hypothetical protein